VIPLRDVIPSRTFPIVNIALIALNALVFLVELSLPDANVQPFMRAFGIVPGNLFWPTIVTSMFVHGGWLHIL